MALSLVPGSEARRVSMRPSSRDGLRALAAAWQASNQSNIRPFARRAVQAPSSPEPDRGAPEPPLYWPDGPSAA